MNLELARSNMIDQQIRPWKPLDGELIELLGAIRRENFVPAAYRGLALADTEIPLGNGVSMWSPKLEARALQALKLGRHGRILEVGTGAGYTAALLAAHAEKVWTVELVPQLADAARANLARAGITNVTVEGGDGAQGWAAHGPYDAILLGGSVPQVPPALLQQLEVGGRLFAVVGEGPAMEAQLITRVAADSFTTARLFETCLPPLAHVKAGQKFVF